MQGIILLLGRYIYLQLKGPTLLSNTSHLYYTSIRDGVWTSFVLFGQRELHKKAVLLMVRVVYILLCVVRDNLELVLGPIGLQ